MDTQDESLLERLRKYLGMNCLSSFTAAELAKVKEIDENDNVKISKGLSYLFTSGWATRSKVGNGHYEYRGEIVQRKKADRPTADEIAARIPSVFPHPPREPGDGYSVGSLIAPPTTQSLLNTMPGVKDWPVPAREVKVAPAPMPIPEQIPIENISPPERARDQEAQQAPISAQPAPVRETSAPAVDIDGEALISINHRGDVEILTDDGSFVALVGRDVAVLFAFLQATRALWDNQV